MLASNVTSRIAQSSKAITKRLNQKEWMNATNQSKFDPARIRNRKLLL